MSINGEGSFEGSINEGGSLLKFDKETTDNTLKPGDTITITDTNGNKQTYVVGTKGEGNMGSEHDNGKNNYWLTPVVNDKDDATVEDDEEIEDDEVVEDDEEIEDDEVIEDDEEIEDDEVDNKNNPSSETNKKKPDVLTLDILGEEVPLANLELVDEPMIEEVVIGDEEVPLVAGAEDVAEEDGMVLGAEDEGIIAATGDSNYMTAGFGGMLAALAGMFMLRRKKEN